MTFSNNLRFLRKKFGYSQEFIAEKLGYKSFTTIQKWESGVSEPSVAKLKMLADLFHISMDELLNVDLSGTESAALSDEEEASTPERQLLALCRRLKASNQEKLFDYAALLLRDEQNEDRR